MSWMNSLVLACLMGSQAVASIPKNTMSITAMDILTLPSSNQLQAALAHKAALIPDLKAIARDSKQAMDVRWRSLALLAALSPAQVALELDLHANSKDWYMRNAALLIAEKYFPEKGLDLARKLLNDKALVIRSAAVDVLANKMADADRDLLWQEASEKRNFRHKKSLWIRAKIVAALARKPLVREAEMFQALLKDNEFKVQVASIKALESIHGKKLGVASDSVAAKAELWQKFAKAGSSVKN